MSDAPLKSWLERDEQILRLQLARPKANIIDAEMISAISAALTSHADDERLMAVVLGAEGPHFSFGASVEEHLPDQCAAMLKKINALVMQMLEYPVPIVAAVQGQCLGGGLELRTCVVLPGAGTHRPAASGNAAPVRQKRRCRACEKNRTR